MEIQKDVIEKDQDSRISIVETLKIFSPGTSIRDAIDDILRARLGALIVIEKEGVFSIIEGGFKVNCRFTPQRLVELAKMDGAIIISKDLKRILYANTLLVPDSSFKTSETGTRHKAAERTAQQIKTAVLAISERRNKVTLYYGDEKYVLEKTSEILTRATETLQILEKQKELFDDSMIHLNILEITDLTSSSDICNILQRMEMIRRVAESVKRNLVELGKEGIIVSMRLKELTKNLAQDRSFILKDYFYNSEDKIEGLLSSMNFDFLLETSNISRLVFEETGEKQVFSRGFRLLKNANILEKDQGLLIDYFKSLGRIFNSDENELATALGKAAFIGSMKKNLDLLKEKILEGKKI